MRRPFRPDDEDAADVERPEPDTPSRFQDPGLTHVVAELAAITRGPLRAGRPGDGPTPSRRGCGNDDPGSPAPRANECGCAPKEPRHRERARAPRTPTPLPGWPGYGRVDPSGDPGPGVPIPSWEPGGFLLDCAIHAPPPPSGELNPDLPDAEVDEFANLGPPPPPPLWSLGDGLGLTAAGVHPWAAPTVGDVLKAPPKPLCPPTWDFDYDWQSCWPADVPHPPPPVGSQWEHACRCGPGMSWLATVHTCWTHGTRPGSSQLGSDAFTGYGPGPAHGTSYLGGVSFVDMPYRTYVFEASQSRVEDVMGDRSRLGVVTNHTAMGIDETVET